MATFNEKMTNIANAIRSKTGMSSDTKLGLDDIAQGIDDVYNAGMNASGNTGGDFYDTFWDTYQNNGNRTDYDHAFYGKYWTDDIFLPKYELKPTSLYYAFSGSKIKTIPKLDVSKCIMFYDAFSYSEVETIERIVIADTQVMTSSCFSGCEFLKNITFIGGYLVGDLDFYDSPLSVSSMVDIINHLKTFDSLEEEFANYTLTFSQECWDKLDTAEPLDGMRWKDVVLTKGWNV